MDGLLVWSRSVPSLPHDIECHVDTTAGRFASLDRDAAARFSFLLLIPIVLGAVLYKGLKHVVLDPLPAGSTGSRSTCCSATCAGTATCRS